MLLEAIQRTEKKGINKLTLYNLETKGGSHFLKSTICVDL